MSKGPGKIERQLEEIIMASDKPWTIKELTAIVYGKEWAVGITTVRAVMRRLQKKHGLAKYATGGFHINRKSGARTGGGRAWVYRRQ